MEPTMAQAQSPQQGKRLQDSLLRLKTKIMGTDLLLRKLSEAKKQVESGTATILSQSQRLEQIEKSLAARELDIGLLQSKQINYEELSVKLEATEQHNTQLAALLKEKCSELAAAKRGANPGNQRALDTQLDTPVKRQPSDQKLMRTVIHLAEILSENNLLNPHYQAKLKKWKRSVKLTDSKEDHSSDGESIEDEKTSKEVQESRLSNIQSDHGAEAETKLSELQLELNSMYNELFVPPMISPIDKEDSVFSETVEATTTELSLNVAQTSTKGCDVIIPDDAGKAELPRISSSLLSVDHGEMSHSFKAPHLDTGVSHHFGKQKQSKKKKGHKAANTSSNNENRKCSTSESPCASQDPRNVSMHQSIDCTSKHLAGTKEDFRKKTKANQQQKLQDSDSDSDGNMSWNSLSTVPIFQNEPLSRFGRRRQRRSHALLYGRQYPHTYMPPFQNHLMPSFGQQLTYMQPPFNPVPYPYCDPYSMMNSSFQYNLGYNNYFNPQITVPGHFNNPLQMQNVFAESNPLLPAYNLEPQQQHITSVNEVSSGSEDESIVDQYSNKKVAIKKSDMSTDYSEMSDNNSKNSLQENKFRTDNLSLHSGHTSTKNTHHTSSSVQLITISDNDSSDSCASDTLSNEAIQTTSPELQDGEEKQKKKKKSRKKKEKEKQTLIEDQQPGDRMSVLPRDSTSQDDKNASVVLNTKTAETNKNTKENCIFEAVASEKTNQYEEISNSQQVFEVLNDVNLEVLQSSQIGGLTLEPYVDLNFFEEENKFCSLMDNFVSDKEFEISNDIENTTTTCMTGTLTDAQSTELNYSQEIEDLFQPEKNTTQMTEPIVAELKESTEKLVESSTALIISKELKQKSFVDDASILKSSLSSSCLLKDFSEIGPEIKSITDTKMQSDCTLSQQKVTAQKTAFTDNFLVPSVPKEKSTRKSIPSVFDTKSLNDGEPSDASTMGDSAHRKHQETPSDSETIKQAKATTCTPAQKEQTLPDLPCNKIESPMKRILPLTVPKNTAFGHIRKSVQFNPEAHIFKPPAVGTMEIRRNMFKQKTQELQMKGKISSPQSKIKATSKISTLNTTETVSSGIRGIGRISRVTTGASKCKPSEIVSNSKEKNNLSIVADISDAKNVTCNSVSENSLDFSSLGLDLSSDSSENETTVKEDIENKVPPPINTEKVIVIDVTESDDQKEDNTVNEVIEIKSPRIEAASLKNLKSSEIIALISDCSKEDPKIQKADKKSGESSALPSDDSKRGPKMHAVRSKLSKNSQQKISLKKDNIHTFKKIKSPVDGKEKVQQRKQLAQLRKKMLVCRRIKSQEKERKDSDIEFPKLVVESAEVVNTGKKIKAARQKRILTPAVRGSDEEDQLSEDSVCDTESVLKHHSSLIICTSSSDSESANEEVQATSNAQPDCQVIKQEDILKNEDLNSLLVNVPDPQTLQAQKSTLVADDSIGSITLQPKIIKIPIIQDSRLSSSKININNFNHSFENNINSTPKATVNQSINLSASKVLTTSPGVFNNVALLEKSQTPARNSREFFNSFAHSTPLSTEVKIKVERCGSPILIDLASDDEMEVSGGSPKPVVQIKSPKKRAADTKTPDIIVPSKTLKYSKSGPSESPVTPDKDINVAVTTSLLKYSQKSNSNLTVPTKSPSIIDQVKPKSPVLAKTRKKVYKTKRFCVKIPTVKTSSTKCKEKPSPKVLPSDRICNTAEVSSYKQDTNFECEEGTRPAKVRLGDRNINSEPKKDEEKCGVKSTQSELKCQVAEKVLTNKVSEKPVVKRCTRQSAYITPTVFVSLEDMEQKPKKMAQKDDHHSSTKSIPVNKGKPRPSKKTGKKGERFQPRKNKNSQIQNTKPDGVADSAPHCDEKEKGEKSNCEANTKNNVEETAGKISKLSPQNSLQVQTIHNIEELGEKERNLAVDNKETSSVCSDIHAVLSAEPTPVVTSEKLQCQDFAAAKNNPSSNTKPSVPIIKMESPDISVQENDWDMEEFPLVICDSPPKSNSGDDLQSQQNAVLKQADNDLGSLVHQGDANNALKEESKSSPSFYNSTQISPSTTTVPINIDDTKDTAISTPSNVDNTCQQGNDTIAKLLVHIKSKQENEQCISKKIQLLSSSLVKDLASQAFQGLPNNSIDLMDVIAQLQLFYPNISLSNVAEAMLLVVTKTSVKEEDTNLNGCVLTNTQCRVLILIKRLESIPNFNGITDTLIQIIPLCILDYKLNKELKDVNQSLEVKRLCALTRILVVLCRSKQRIQPLRSLMCETLCCFPLKSSAIAFEILSVWPDVIPPLKGPNNPEAKYSNIKELPIKFQCLVYALLRLQPKDDLFGDNKVQLLLQLLSSQYNYKPDMISANNILQHIIDQLQGGELKGIENGLLLLSHCEGVEWSKQFLVKGLLQQLVDNHAQSPFADTAAQVAVRVIGFVTNQVPSSQLVFAQEVLKKMENLLQNKDTSEKLRESICHGILFLKDVIPVPELLKSLAMWVPKEPLSQQFQLQLTSFAESKL